MMRVRWYAVQMIALVVVLFSGVASAQNDPTSQVLSQFFSVSTPGARANGMGRAFVGVADDASAAITNPAGLMFLTRPQVYFEFKSSGYDSTVTGASENAIKSLRARLPYFALSMPINDRVAVAFSRHEFFGADIVFPSIGFEEHIRGTSYSGSVATTIVPTVKIGVTLSGGNISEDTDNISENAFGFTVGGLWQATPQVSIGVSGTGWSGSGSADTFVAPNQLKFGVGYGPTPQFKVAVDIVQVFYPSDVTDDATEFHLGGEYQIMSGGSHRFFVRTGLYTGREGELNFSTTPTTKTTTTGTFGGGVVIGQQFQVDLAVLTRKELVVSAAYRF
jgi:long-subunit fatty acid transport protein